MSIFVDTSDKRNQFVLNFLLDKNLDVKVYLENVNKIKRGDIIIFSPAKKFLYEDAINFCDETIVYCGNLPQEILQIFTSKNITVKNYLRDEIFAINNAKLTAEGLLSLIIEKTEKSLKELKILFLGGGRITKATANLLSKLGVEFGVVSYNENDYNLAHFYCEKVYYKEEFISKLSYYNLIVNTRPFCYINEEILSKINDKTLFIETASVKSVSQAEKINFNYIFAPALPQKYACESAGKIIADKIIGELND